MLTKNNDRIPVGGVRLSEELVQVSVDLESCDISTSDLLKEITAKQISLVSLSHTSADTQNQLVLTVFKENFDDLKQCFQATTEVCADNLLIYYGIGSISIFPHRNDFSSLSTLLSIFFEHNFPVYSVSSSISAISINTDFAQFEAICNLLEHYFIIPENHAPFRQQFRVCQVPQVDGDEC